MGIPLTHIIHQWAFSDDDLTILILGPGLRTIRARHVYPRIDYVEVKGENPKALFRGMAIYTLFTMTATGLAIYIFRGGLPPDAIRRVSPLIAAVLFGGGLSYAAGKTGLRRYTVLFVIGITLATALVIAPIEGRYLNLQIFFVSMGLVSLITGSVLYLYFLRTHPVRDPEENGDV